LSSTSASEQLQKAARMEIEKNPILIKPAVKFFNRLAKIAKRHGVKPGRLCMDVLEYTLPKMESGELVLMNRQIVDGGKR
jgi:hypothetical protein